LSSEAAGVSPASWLLRELRRGGRPKTQNISFTGEPDPPRR
jgi:hypothetical protein